MCGALHLDWNDTDQLDLRKVGFNWFYHNRMLISFFMLRVTGCSCGMALFLLRSGFKSPFFAISQVEVVFDHHFDQPLEIDFGSQAEFIANF